MTVWNSRAIQFVWFPKVVEGLRADTLYQALVGQEPDAFQQSKIPTARTPFLGMANGETDNLAFTVQINPGRVDLIATAPEASTETALELSEIDTSATINRVLQYIEQSAVDLMGTVTRLSIVANLTKEAPDYPAAATQILDAWSIPLELKGHSDFVLQLNLRKTLNVGISINRIMKYSVESHRAFAISVDATTGIPVSNSPIGDERIACSLQLDFNTLADGSEIAPKVQLSVLREIAAEILAVGANGTISALEN